MCELSLINDSGNGGCYRRFRIVLLVVIRIEKENQTNNTFHSSYLKRVFFDRIQSGDCSNVWTTRFQPINNDQKSASCMPRRIAPFSTNRQFRTSWFFKNLSISIILNKWTIILKSIVSARNFPSRSVGYSLQFQWIVLGWLSSIKHFFSDSVINLLSLQRKVVRNGGHNRNLTTLHCFCSIWARFVSAGCAVRLAQLSLSENWRI